MPLERGRILGYDADRMAFEFTMLNKDQTVPCEISSAAMDELAGKRGTLPAEREAQFLRFAKPLNALRLIISIATLLSAFSQSIFEGRQIPSIILMRHEANGCA